MLQESRRKIRTTGRQTRSRTQRQGELEQDCSMGVMSTNRNRQHRDIAVK